MALKTTLERLEEAEAAETAILLGQSYTIGDQTVTRADLDKVQRLINKLRHQYHRECGRGLSINIGIPRRDY